MSQQSSNAEPYIKLDQFLKWQGITQTGGEAKIMIKEGNVLVNDSLETRRGRKLRTGDSVTVNGQKYRVELNDF